MTATTLWTSPYEPGLPGMRAKVEVAARLATALLLSFVAVEAWIADAASRDEDRIAAQPAQVSGDVPAGANREIFLAGYVGAPFYYRSDVQLQQPNGTDVVLKKLGWDGDALYFPVDGGIRSVEWWGRAGLMVDFLHNKAIARLGKGAHGRKLSNPVIESVETNGTIAGRPAPSPLKLTDIVERLEFTHGHNVLLLTPMVRTGAIAPGIRPYFGLGGGFALPHVEVWFTGAPREERTNEYQFAGPAAQAVAGLELRTGKFSYFVEYKFTWAWIKAALTGDESWKNFNMPGDLWRQFSRWWSGEKPPYGELSTRLSAHQLVVGAGYWWQRPR